MSDPSAKWGRIANTLHATALMSHVACCGAPLVMNAIALAFGAGLITVAAPWMESAHGLLHGKEAALLAVSACLVVAGGVSQYLSWRADCSTDDHCHHEPCAPKKPRRAWVFGLVCVLFLGNVGLYAWHQEQSRVAASAHHELHDAG